MKHDDFGRDRGLQARMLLTLFMLGLIYVVLIAVALSAGASMAAVLLIAAAFFAVQLFASDRIALAAMGAREVPVADAPELHASVERLCVQADVPQAATGARQRNQRSTASMSALFIMPPRRGGALTRLFATHPPVEKRVAALGRLESQLQAA